MGVLADLIALVNGNTEKTLDVLIQEKATETNGKVDSKASQTSVDTVKNLVQDGNNLVGANNNTGGSIGVGSISARINKLLTDWTTTRAGYLDTINTNVGTLLNGRIVKSVQRGTVQLPSTLGSDSPLLVSINAVNASKTAIFKTNSSGSIAIFIRLINDTQLEFRRLGTTGTFTDWQVIEFY